MLLRRLELVDIRSYARLGVDFAEGTSLLLGPNAHGKTNLVEAVYRVATGSSHRVSSDVPLVRHGAEAGYIRAFVTTDGGRRRSIELELRPGRGTTGQVDGQTVRRAADATGVLRAVLFAPEDTAIVVGEPDERRRFLDQLLAQRRPAYGATLGEYHRVLRQRNELLRSIRGGDDGPRRTLGVWDEQLAEHAALLTAARIAAVHALSGPAAGFYHRLSQRPEELGFNYRSSAGFDVRGESGAAVDDPAALTERIRSALALRADEERARGVTLVGPHRDDLIVDIAGLPARGYASHGQAWSAALAFRLASYEILAEVGDRPLVLLDDVFAELDETRRRGLAGACAGFEQVLVTAAVEADVPLADAAVMDVRMEAGVSTVRGRDRLARRGDATA